MEAPDWPVPLNGELVAALDGNWIDVEKSRAKAERPRRSRAASRLAPKRKCSRRRATRSRR